ncbi:MAG: response regulator transcription factor [Sphaerochaetaceae bacterium]|nr:response regulator transcription factor [Sphaerochaetaceae bacterium]
MRKTICIIDDEIRSRERVKRILDTRDDFLVIGEADNGKAAVSLIDEKLPDIVLLDIKMPGLSGFQVLRQAQHRPAVIFITAYNEHAVQAFEVHAVDYVLKPFQDERLFEALSRVPSRTTPDDQVLQQLSFLVEGGVPGVRKYQTRFTVKDRFELKVVDVNDIDFFATEDSLVCLYTHGIRYIVDKTLSQIEESVNPEQFFRAHRKSLVNLNRVERILPWGRGRYVLKFSHDERVHVSKDKTREFKSLIGLV